MTYFSAAELLFGLQIDPVELQLPYCSSLDSSAWPRGEHRKKKVRWPLTLLSGSAVSWRTNARLYIMAASKPVEPQAGTGLPRWQLALLVGTPIVLGVGAVYLWNRSRTKGRKGTDERKTPEGSASPVQGQDGAVRNTREQDNMVTLPSHFVSHSLHC